MCKNRLINDNQACEFELIFKERCKSKSTSEELYDLKKHDFDIILKCENDMIQTNKNVLFSHSDYFKGMFSLDMKEKNASFVNMEGVNGNVMSTILDLLNQSTNHDDLLSSCNVCDVFATSDYLLIGSVKNICIKYLLEHIAPKNCLSTRKFANFYLIGEVLKEAEYIICEQYELVLSAEEFQHLDIEEMILLLKWEDKAVASEKNVYHSVMKWIKVNIKKCQIPLYDIINLISLRKLPADFLEAVVSKEKIFTETKSLKELINYHMKEQMKKCDNYSTMYFISKSPKNFGVIKKYDTIDKCWVKIPILHKKVPEQSFGSCTVCVNGILYMMGGKVYPDDGEHYITDSVECLKFEDPTSSWKKSTPLNEKLAYFDAAVIDDQIYISGGERRYERYYRSFYLSKSIYSFSTTSNIWTRVGELIKPRCNHCVVTLNGLIYSIGGWIHRHITDSVECFDPKTKTTKLVSSMNTPMYNSSAATLNGKIYVVHTKHNYDVFNEYYANDNIVERYNPEMDTWTIITPSPFSMSWISVSAVNGKMYVFGGCTPPVCGSKLLVFDNFENMTSSEELDITNDCYKYSHMVAV